jgi:23S rRNA (cytidine2498-2'-O)-methyltransferase
LTSSPRFSFVCCAHGAEPAVKDEVAEQGWRLAFSRPGFVTLKREVPTAPNAAAHAPDHSAASDLPSGIFVRTASHSIGQVRADTSGGYGKGEEMIAALVALVSDSHEAQRPFDQIHVWPKDRAAIGRFDFEPGVDEVSRAVGEEILRALQGTRRISPQPVESESRATFVRSSKINVVAQPGERVLDIVLVEPTHWFVGFHVASTWPTRWPGAVQPIELAEPPVSRAYYKAAEAIAWSGFNLRAGDQAFEIGSAPGGACQRLLELGLHVTGVDPAEMDEAISSHPRYTHIQARGGDLPRKRYSGAKWLLVDSNVKPEQTLQTVENIVTNQHCHLVGLLLTLKIGDYASAERIESWRKTIQGWGVADIRIRQLARNRCEVCLAVRLKEQT